MVRARFRVDGADVFLQPLQGGLLAVCGRWTGRDGGERTQQETLADRGGTSWGRWISCRWVSGWEWNRSQPCQGATHIALPWANPWEDAGSTGVWSG